VRLTHRRLEIYPQVAARNDTVHVAATDRRPEHVSYLRSTDGAMLGQILGIWKTRPPLRVRQDLWLTPDYVFVGWRMWSGKVSLLTSDLLIRQKVQLAASSIHISRGVGLYDLGTAAFRDSIYAVYFSEEQDSIGAHLFKFLYSSDMGVLGAMK